MKKKKSVANGDFQTFAEKIKYKCIYCGKEFKEPKVVDIPNFRPEEEYGPFADGTEDVCPKCGKVVKEYAIERAGRLWNEQHPDDKVINEIK